MKDQLTETRVTFELSQRFNHSILWNKQKTDGKLTNIFKETGTDKLSTHHYDRFYELFLAPYREDGEVKLLEIGADTGRSIAAWAKYFKKAALITGVRYGVSTDSQKIGCKAAGLPPDCPKIKIEDGNQNDPVFLQKLAETTWDVIIDDGSHVPEHQIRSFAHLFPSVSPGGLYVIEDVETSYWKSPNKIYGQQFVGSGIGRDYPGNVVPLFQDLVHIMNRKYFANADEFILAKDIDHEIASIMFAPNSIFIFKKDNGFGTVGRPAKGNTNEAFKTFANKGKEKLNGLKLFKEKLRLL